MLEAINIWVVKGLLTETSCLYLVRRVFLGAGKKENREKNTREFTLWKHFIFTGF